MADVVLRIYILTIGVVSFFLLFPSWSNLSVFSKGEFIYTESLGLIFLYLTFFLIISYFISCRFSLLKIKKKLFRHLIFFVATGISIFTLLFVITYVWIRFDVKQQCLNSKRIYGGSCLEASSNLLKDKDRDFRSRNSAVWVLGQLADKKALPVLKSFYTGVIPDREPLDKIISQYELKKAIRWCEEGNWTSWMYTIIN